jgi:hypothetical protein
VHLVGTAQRACLDHDIAPLMAFLWAAGCTTLHSCQGNPVEDPTQWAHVVFADGSSFDKALNAMWGLVGQRDMELLSRLTGIGVSTGNAALAWRHSAVVHPETLYGRSLQVVHILKFPPHDLAQLTDWITEEIAIRQARA